MSWFKKIPFLSLILLFITYSTFGWYVNTHSITIGQIILNQINHWGLVLFWKDVLIIEESFAIVLLYVFCGLTISLITLSLVSPIALLTGMFGSSFKSNATSILSILVWAFIFVFMMRWIVFFARLLLLLCAAILAKLDLQDNGYPGWLVFWAVKVISLTGFFGGVIAHDLYTQSINPLDFLSFCT